jgi:hypothetical protein
VAKSARYLGAAAINGEDGISLVAG